MVDVTEQVRRLVADAGVDAGLCLVFSPHTTCAVTVNEGWDPDVQADVLRHLGSLVPRDAGYAHSEGNSDSHIKTIAVGPSVLLPVDGGLGPDHWTALDGEARAVGYQVLRYHAGARVLRPRFTPQPGDGRVAVLTAGTSDLAAADEARMVIEACGLEARVDADLGVAGLHRLLGPLADVLAWDPDAVVVAAGMDGVLPGVVAGLIDRPVIGLPVSTGYGHGRAGEAALGTVLQSCSTGLLVVNIDNGVGAGAAAVLIAARAAHRALPGKR